MAQKARAAAKKIKDRWRAKEWYKIYAPDMFSRMQLGETPSNGPESVMGRIAEATVQDMTGDFSKMHIKLRFKVHDVRGFDAFTLYEGHNLTSDYVRRLTRRKRTKTDTVVDVITKDGWEVRVKPMAVSEQRIQASQETAIRNIMKDSVAKMAAESTISDLVRKMIMGDMSKAISDASKIIVPVKRIEIGKSEVLRSGKMPEPDEQPIIAPAEEPAQDEKIEEIEEQKPADVSTEETPVEQPAESEDGSKEEKEE
ncbi:MAG: 30S ribosomal protein S3ae [Candidatus Thermoplasmatota archaeon]|nr:30S ribosomal protein S3ae [Candidatus Thermoplasmatota archaeon]